MKILKKTAFTLVELIIVIVIIGMILVISSGLNLNTLSDKQKAEIFANDIISKIELARNNALVGKSIKDGTDEIIPNKWRIDINKNSKFIRVNYLNKSNNFIPNKDFSFDNSTEEIFKIECGNGKEFTEINFSEITFEGKKAIIKSGNNCTDKYILKILAGRNTQKFEIIFDSTTTILRIKK